MKVFVTGGEGFIGSHVSDYLLSLGHDVVVIDNLFSGRDHWQARAVGPESQTSTFSTGPRSPRCSRFICLKRSSTLPHIITSRSATGTRWLPTN